MLQWSMETSCVWSPLRVHFLNALTAAVAAAGVRTVVQHNSGPLLGMRDRSYLSCRSLFTRLSGLSTTIYKQTRILLETFSNWKHQRSEKMSNPRSRFKSEHISKESNDYLFNPPGFLSKNGIVGEILNGGLRFINIMELDVEMLVWCRSHDHYDICLSGDNSSTEPNLLSVSSHSSKNEFINKLLLQSRSVP